MKVKHLKKSTKLAKIKCPLDLDLSCPRGPTLFGIKKHCWCFIFGWIDALTKALFTSILWLATWLLTVSNYLCSCKCVFNPYLFVTSSAFVHESTPKQSVYLQNRPIRPKHGHPASSWNPAPCTELHLLAERPEGGGIFWAGCRRLLQQPRLMVTSSRSLRW